MQGSVELVDQPGQRSGEAARGLRRWTRLGRMPGSVEHDATVPIPHPTAGLCSPAFFPWEPAQGQPAGHQSYQSPNGRFALPHRLDEVQVSNDHAGVHDLIHSDETVNLMVNKVEDNNDLADLGSAVAVGERLRREVIATAGSGRTAELIEAGEREINGHTFYDLEYAVHLEDRDRHELATVVVDRELYLGHQHQRGAGQGEGSLRPRVPQSVGVTLERSLDRLSTSFPDN